QRNVRPSPKCGAHEPARRARLPAEVGCADTLERAARDALPRQSQQWHARLEAGVVHPQRTKSGRNVDARVTGWQSSVVKPNPSGAIGFEHEAPLTVGRNQEPTLPADAERQLIAARLHFGPEVEARGIIEEMHREVV